MGSLFVFSNFGACNFVLYSFYKYTEKSVKSLPKPVYYLVTNIHAAI